MKNKFTTKILERSLTELLEKIKMKLMKLLIVEI